MNDKKLLFLDTETGGTDPNKHSLLSMALVVWQDYKIVDSVEILIDDGFLNVTEEAMKINKIDLENHKKNSISINEAVKKFFYFIDKYFSRNERIVLAGHNIAFDINFIKNFLLANNYNFSDRFSHRCVDTSSILYYLYCTGVIKSKEVSSQEAFDFFKISVMGRHTAKGDAVATAELFNVLIGLIKKNKEISDSDGTQKCQGLI